ncbi:MAG: rhodanese-like domain-containing protein [Anaeromyxobacteraceae bacterium]
MLNAGVALLVDVEGDRRVVQLVRGATLAGVSELSEIGLGDRVGYSVVRQVSGVRLADVLSVPPSLLGDRSVMLRADEAEPGVAAGTLLPIDVRSVEAFEAAHLQGARSAPSLERLEDVLAGADPVAPVLFYGESAKSPLVLPAVRKAMELGYANVKVLEDGLRAWRSSGRLTWVSPRHLVNDAGARLRVIDVRPRAEVAQGAIPGSVPLTPEGASGVSFIGTAWPPPLVIVGVASGDPAALAMAGHIRNHRSSDERASVAPVQLLEGGYAAWLEAGGIRGGLDTLAAPEVLLLQEPDRAVVTRAEFERVWAAGAKGKTLVDVRPQSKGTPPFALHIPLDQLHRRLSEIPGGREVIVFCSVGIRSRVAFEILAGSGLEVRYLRDRPPTSW